MNIYIYIYIYISNIIIFHNNWPSRQICTTSYQCNYNYIYSGIFCFCIINAKKNSIEIEAIFEIFLAN